MYVLGSLESQACWFLCSVNLGAAEVLHSFLLLSSWWLGRTQKVFSSDLLSCLAAHFYAAFFVVCFVFRDKGLTI